MGQQHATRFCDLFNYGPLPAPPPAPEPATLSPPDFEWVLSQPEEGTVVYRVSGREPELSEPPLTARAVLRILGALLVYAGSPVGLLHLRLHEVHLRPPGHPVKRLFAHVVLKQDGWLALSLVTPGLLPLLLPALEKEGTLSHRWVLADD